MSDSETVSEVIPQHRQLPLRGLYLEHALPHLAAQLQHALVLTPFLTDRNGVIAKADEHGNSHVPSETRNASDWRLTQELMAQADVVISGGSYLRRVASPGSPPQDILFQFEPGGEFADLGDWRLRAAYERRSPDLAIVARHLDFRIPDRVLQSGRRTAILTTDSEAHSEQARAFTALGTAVIGAGESGVDGGWMIDYLHDQMAARVIVMASGPSVLQLLLQSKRLDLLYLTQVQRQIEFDDPSQVITLLPNGRTVEDLKVFSLSHKYAQDQALAGDGSVISQYFLRYDRDSLLEVAP